MMASDSAQPQEDNTEILQFNLTNPEQLTRQLTAASLDDQETDTLLKEALRINAQLKEALRLQQLEESSEDGMSTSSNRMQDPYFQAEPPAPRNPKQSILPPISSHSDRSTVSGGRRKQKDSTSKSLMRGQARVGSAPRAKATPPARRVKRPEWDDRFSYGDNPMIDTLGIG